MNTLIVISPETNVPDEHKIVNVLFDNGLEYFHVRKPDMGIEDLKKYIDKVQKKYHKKLILHSHHSIVDDMQLGGKHLTSKAIIKKEQHHSKSFHTLKGLASNKKHLQYAFLSPVFNSISKAGYKAGFTNKNLQSFLQNRSGKTKIIALGGIDEYTAQSAIQLGFDGVAVLGTIWQNPTVEKALEQFEKIKFVINKLSAAHFTP
jgi:thiamine monophosphate synthase